MTVNFNKVKSYGSTFLANWPIETIRAARPTNRDEWQAHLLKTHQIHNPTDSCLQGSGSKRTCWELFQKGMCSAATSSIETVQIHLLRKRPQRIVVDFLADSSNEFFTNQDPDPCLLEQEVALCH